MPLTAARVKNLRDNGTYGDGGGLYLLIDDDGKRWFLRTVFRGKRKVYGLGGYSTTSLAEARELAAEMRKAARKGRDPADVRQQYRHTGPTVPTFQEAAEAVHGEHCAGWKNPKHRQQWINTLTRYAIPVFGSKMVSDVDSADVLKALKEIWLKKPETARRVRQRIRVVCRWAKAQGYRTNSDPTEGIENVLPRQPRTQQHFEALPYVEVPQFLQSLHGTNVSESVKLAFEFLILTAARTGEVLGATWEEMDLDQKTWIIPADRMKMKRLHRVPLSPRCMQLLKAAKKLSSKDNPYVFPGQKKGKPLSNMAFLMALRRMDRDCTAHGFRSTFRDYAAEQTNIPAAVCEAALAHTIKDKAEAAYNRTDLFDKRRKLMESWATYATATKGKVVKMGRKQRA